MDGWRETVEEGEVAFLLDDHAQRAHDADRHVVHLPPARVTQPLHAPCPERTRRMMLSCCEERCREQERGDTPPERGS
eukprot:599289-Rhodomonas_salina.1